jgi:hypothetical protein
MGDAIERTQVAAPPGRVWQAARELVADAHVARSVETREMEWLTTDPDGSTRRWWIRLEPSWQGTLVEHGCRPAHDGSDDESVTRDAVRNELVRTLREVKARAEGQ